MMSHPLALLQPRKVLQSMA